MRKLLLLLGCLVLLGWSQEATSSPTTSSCPEDSVPVEDNGTVSGELCRCVSPCPKHECQPGQQPVRLRDANPDSPGRCCPLYECRDQDVVNYQPDEAAAQHQCLDDVGQTHENGSSWRELGDPCVECSCEAGQRHCLVAMCRGCENPLPRLPDECCPRCPDTPRRCASPKEVCQDCTMGRKLDPDTGCPLCRCEDDVSHEDEDEDSAEEEEDEEEDNEESEDDDSEECPRLRCRETCEFGRLTDDNGCEVCGCRERACPPCSSGDDKKCPRGYATDLHGCPVCWRCRNEKEEQYCLDERNVTRPPGSSWRPAEDTASCRSCSCREDGSVLCVDEDIVEGCSLACASNPRCCRACTPVTYMLDSWRHWGGLLPLVLISSMALLSFLLVLALLRLRHYRGRLTPSTTGFVTTQHQYYKCVPMIYEPSHAGEKIAPL